MGEMGETQEVLSSCPTFNSYSTDRLAEIAARVTDEFSQHNLSVLREDNDVDSDDFEFSLVKDGLEIFYDGQFGPVFPIFNRDLVVNDDRGDGGMNHHNNKQETSDGAVGSQIGISLKDLFIQDREQREPPSSSSSSEADEMEGIPPGTYCVWRPKKVESSPLSLGKKSNSTGSGSASKRWKFLHLLRRSNSEGKDTYVFLTPKLGEVKSGKDEPSSREVVKATRKLKAKAAVESPSPSSAHEAFYVRNRAMKQGDKKKSYLPYRKDLVGFFANVNGLSRTFPPF